MIKVQDWVATIPDEDKHIAYVGEDNSVTRQFLLCGDGWKRFREWQFHLDMAFDRESATFRDSRQVVQTTRNYQETVKEEGKVVDEVTSKETYTVHSEETTNQNQYDIASLEKEVGDDGITLTWKVLCQQTSLPGKLWATLRAVKPDGTAIKKSAIMVFEVDAAIPAVPATRPTKSEFEEMENRIDALCEEALYRSDEAHRYSTMAYQSAATAAESAARLETLVEETQEHCAAAERTVDAAEEARLEARKAANAASSYVTQTAENAQTCLDASAKASKAEERSLRYLQESEGYVQMWEDSVQSLDNLMYRRVNVRDCGAVGDGVADDRQAIIKAFEQAKSMLPCEVYFPAGTYGIGSGITIEMAYGTGGLRVCGAGCDVTTIKYLDDYTSQQGWYAIRIWPVGRPDIIPDEDDYLHDISYTGLTVYDPDPIGHALNTAKGDPATEETHGFDIHCCKGVSVTDCQFITVGDEAIDICFCHDVVVMNNRLISCPGAGSAGGAISIGDGCKGVVVCGNTINGSAPDEVLEDGTVLTKSNAGIVVETPSGYPVQDVTIIGNTIRNVHGKGIILSAETAGASLVNAIAADNIISGCDIGILVSGAQLKDNIKIANNVIADCVGHAIEARTNVGNITICGNTIRNIKGDYAIHTATQNANSRQYIADNVFENIEYGGVYCAGNVVLKDCVFNGLGTAATAPTTNTYGVYRYNGVLIVSGCTFKDVRMFALKSCLQNVDYIDNTDVEVVNKSTGVVDGGGYSVAGVATKRIIGCSLIGGVGIQQDNAIVQGTKIVSSVSGDAVVVSANRVSIIGCIIENNSKTSSYKAIKENSGYNYNLFANNIVNRSIVIVGAQSVAVNNIDTRVTA